MYGWNWVRNAAYPTLKPTQDVLASHRIYQSWAQKNPENATGMAEDAQSERQARAAAHANTSIM